jgi:Family of unknown function (DUF5989)
MAQDPDEFLRTSRGRRASLPRELWSMLRDNKKWWLTPIVVMMLLLGLISLLAGSAVAPFIYTLF